MELMLIVSNIGCSMGRSFTTENPDVKKAGSEKRRSANMMG